MTASLRQATVALLTTHTGLFAFQGDQGALGVVLAVQKLYKKVLEVVKRDEAEQDLEDYVETLGQSAQIPNKIEYAVHVPIDPI